MKAKKTQKIVTLGKIKYKDYIKKAVKHKKQTNICIFL